MRHQGLRQSRHPRCDAVHDKTVFARPQDFPSVHEGAEITSRARCPLFLMDPVTSDLYIRTAYPDARQSPVQIRPLRQYARERASLPSKPPASRPSKWALPWRSPSPADPWSQGPSARTWRPTNEKSDRCTLFTCRSPAGPSICSVRSSGSGHCTEGIANGRYSGITAGTEP